MTRQELKLLKMERKGNVHCYLYLFPVLEHLPGCISDPRPTAFLAVRRCGHVIITDVVTPSHTPDASSKDKDVRGVLWGETRETA